MNTMSIKSAIEEINQEKAVLLKLIDWTSESQEREAAIRNHIAENWKTDNTDELIQWLNNEWLLSRKWANRLINSGSSAMAGMIANQTSWKVAKLFSW